MAIILPGIDVGSTGSKAASVGANGAVTATPPTERLLITPIVNRLLAAGPAKVGIPAAFVYRSVAPRGLAAGTKAALRGIGPAAGRHRHSLGGRKVMRRSNQVRRSKALAAPAVTQPG